MIVILQVLYVSLFTNTSTGCERHVFMVLKKVKKIRILKLLLVWFSFPEEDAREMSYRGIMDTVLRRFPIYFIKFCEFYALF